MDTKTLALDSSHTVRYQATPWNDPTVGGKSWEIIEITYQRPDKIAPLLKMFEQERQQQQVCFASIRFSANDLRLRKVLYESGFYFVEQTLQIGYFLGKRASKPWEKFLKNEPVAVKKPHHIAQIKQIAAEAFSHGRFFEDPNICPNLAKQRNANWIEYAAANKQLLLAYLLKDQVSSFMLVLTDEANKHLNFLFGGSKPGKAFTFPAFIAGSLRHFSQKGYQTMEARISAANVGIVNIYLTLGGKAKNSSLGYHKHYM